MLSQQLDEVKIMGVFTLLTFIIPNKLFYFMYLVLFYKLMKDTMVLKTDFYKLGLTKLIYKKKLVTNVKYIRYVNFLQILALLIPFTYLGYYIKYIFSTFVLNVIYVHYFYTRFLVINRIHLLLNFKEEKLTRVDNLPKDMTYKVVENDETTDGNCLNIIISGPVTVYYKDNKKYYKNIYISHNDIFSFDVLQEI